jgi:hypothetical protein
MIASHLPALALALLCQCAPVKTADEKLPTFGDTVNVLGAVSAESNPAPATATPWR